MLDFRIDAANKNLIKIQKETQKNGCFQTHKITISFLDNLELSNQAIRIGFFSEQKTAMKSFIMTHEELVNEYQIPFAFPCLMVKTNEDDIAGLLVVDYYKTATQFRTFYKDDRFLGIINKPFRAEKGEVYKVFMSSLIIENSNLMLTEIIGKAASFILSNYNYEGVFSHDYSRFIKTYEDAALGLTNNLLDPRSRIQDGVGTFIPYCYLEERPYSESFVAMDVAKGLYPYSIIKENQELKNFIKETLYLMVDQNQEYRWIDTAHNTEGFFHLAWGSIPPGVTFSDNVTKPKGLFSDFDGHEEGPNLLSTWKYFSRVQLLGEMALLSKDHKIIEGFKKTLKFVNDLKMEGYYQPVTYDLDTHLPATGATNGGSAGGIAFWSIIHLTAYLITKDDFYLAEAKKALEAANTLDFDRYFSMRQAPKPITVGWLVKSHVLAYEITGDIKYINRALKIAQSIYFFYYISPHPYTYFSTLGFGYACARERWEAFLEMLESLYALAPILKYNNDENLLKLFALARQHILWAIPLNGNPYGNLDRMYDSIGGEYVPYEFSTGSMGDNTGLDGGSQSSSRQIKEIYGSGEVYLAYMLFEAHAFSSDKNVLVVKSYEVGDLLNDEMDFVIYNYKNESTESVIVFNHLVKDAYEIEGLYKQNIIKNKTDLEQGIKVKLKSREIKQIKIRPIISNEISRKKIFNQNLDINYQGVEKINLTWNKVPSVSHYCLKIENPITKNKIYSVSNFITLELDREIEQTITILAITDQDIKLDTIKLPSLSKTIKYEKEFTSDIVKTENCDVIIDGHMMMFYGKDIDKKSMKVFFELDDVLLKDTYIRLDIASLNTFCSWDAVLHFKDGRKILSKNEKNTGVFEYYFKNKLITTGLEIIINSTYGMGFSINRLEIYDLSNKSYKNIYFGNEFIETSQGYKLLIPNNDFKYIEVLVSNLAEGEAVYFYQNNQELIAEMEKKYPAKINRKNNGVYKFKINTFNEWTFTVKSTNQDKLPVALVRLTKSNDYQRITDYKKYLRRELTIKNH